MKKVNLLLLLFVALLLGACVQSNEVDYDGPRTTIDLSLGRTKTALGNKTGDSYPIYWATTDRIVMNGEPSDVVTINQEDSRRASFSFKGMIDGERYITFPYTKGSSCTAEQPTVVFPANQSYIKGTFDLNAAPMCGYSVDGEGTTTLQHLAGVLRFPFIASVPNTTIKQISITATSADATLAGEFEVDCKTGDITAIKGTTSKSIVYSLGESGLALSTSKATPVFITLPKGSFGSCVIAVTDTNGRSMMLKWTANNIKPGIVREFGNIYYTAEGTLSLDAFESVEDEIEIGYTVVLEDMDIFADDILIDYIPGLVFGYIKDTTGNPVAGVAVSDGFTVVKTNSNGFYQMEANPEAYHIFYTSPAEYKIPINENGQACFFKKFSYFHSLYNFTLEPLSGGKESKFTLFGMADPQVSSDAGYTRFINEAVPKIKRHADSLSEPCYGVVLGDIITMSTSTDKTNYMYQMRTQHAADIIGMPVFYVMGNHDHNFHNASQPLTTDWRNKTTNIRAQRLYEEIFGPANYSFDRGDAHIIAMRDILYTKVDDPSTYQTAFTDEQLAWLEADLANVSKDKLILLCVHIQIYNNSRESLQAALELLNKFPNVHILSGHWHRNRNFEHSVEGSSHTNIYEHNISAVCGSWWSSNIAGDGAPNGYKIFEIEGNQIVNWYFQGIPDGMDDKNHQIRLYRGNAITGAAIPDGDANTNGTKGYYKFNFAENVILANIFSSDTKWKVDIYENGKKTGSMTKMGIETTTGCTVDQLVGTYVLTDPRRVPDGIELSHDMWATGFQMGILGRAKNSNATFEACYTMWKGTLKNPNAASIKVVATDRFGNKFECSTFSATAEGSDYTYVAKP